MNKSLMLLGFFWAVMLTAAEDRAVLLERIKREFPQHTAGEITERSDPILRDCYLGYRKMVMALTEENLGQKIGPLRQSADGDINWGKRLNFRDSRTSSAIKEARRLNYEWVKNSLRPYILRLEALQQGMAPH